MLSSQHLHNTTEHTNLINEVYKITNYKFRNESILLEVFSPHLNPRNVTSPYCFERLEFLGDSVLNLIISIILFDLYPMETEGDLTLRKNDLVSGRRLSEISQTLDFMKLIVESPIKITRRDSDTLEALIGAIYIDGGFKSARQFIITNWKKLARQLQVAIVDPKTKLYIWAQKRHLPTPIYKIINRTQLETNFTLTLQMKETHGLGIVKLTANIKKRGETDAARAMLARISNRERWKILFKSQGEYITEQDLVLTKEDIKKRLFLWCLSQKMGSPNYTTQVTTLNGKSQFTTLVTVGTNRGAFGVSTVSEISEKKAALKILLRFCDEEREQEMFGCKTIQNQVNLCNPQNFKSLLSEWVTKNHLGDIVYHHKEIIPGKLYNVSLTIPSSNLGTVFSKSNTRQLADYKAAAVMIEKILTTYSDSRYSDSQKSQDVTNYKNKLYVWTQSKKLPIPIYSTVNVTGMRNSLFFTVSLSVEGQNNTFASDYSKRHAQQKAAMLMIKSIQSSI